MNARHEMLSSLRLVQYDVRWGRPAYTALMDVAGRPAKFHVIDAPRESLDLNEGRPFSILLTDGLSDEPHAGAGPRCELVWYVESPAKVHSDWLHFAATVHIMDRVDLYERTMPLAGLLDPLAPGSVLTSVMFITSPVRCDQEPLRIDGTETELLWLVPISERERTSLQGLGNAFGARVGDMLDDNRHPIVLRPARTSYV